MKKTILKLLALFIMTTQNLNVQSQLKNESGVNYPQKKAILTKGILKAFYRAVSEKAGEKI